jgi:tRNA (guanine-N7-)-methyltransferase
LTELLIQKGYKTPGDITQKKGTLENAGNLSVMLKKMGIIHFKTDNTGLFDYTLELFQNRADIELIGYSYDFYQSEWKDDHFGIKTRYEKIFSDKGEMIKYLKCRFIG